jgi:hypothetical protein
MNDPLDSGNALPQPFPFPRGTLARWHQRKSYALFKAWVAGSESSRAHTLDVALSARTECLLAVPCPGGGYCGIPQRSDALVRDAKVFQRLTPIRSKTRGTSRVQVDFGRIMTAIVFRQQYDSAPNSCRKPPNLQTSSNYGKGKTSGLRSIWIYIWSSAWRMKPSRS